MANPSQHYATLASLPLDWGFASNRTPPRMATNGDTTMQPKMTIAQQVDAVISEGKAAVSLQYGYAIDYVGKRFPFEPGHVVSEKRNAEGRCTSMVVSYKDGSTISFKWSEQEGASYTVGQVPAQEQKPDTVTVDQIAQAVADNAKTGKWLSCTYQLAHPQAVGGTVAIGIKAFGKWVQVIQCLEFRDGLPEQKTLKALKAGVIDLINGMLKSAGLSGNRQYYLVNTRGDYWDMRQTRYKAQMASGKEHPHDLCATGFSAQQMCDLVAQHGFDVDLSPLEKEGK